MGLILDRRVVIFILIIWIFFIRGFCGWLVGW
jgi:hypothetical protein